MKFNEEKLREVIASASISQAELARVAGVRRSGIHNYLTGKSRPSIEVLARICHHLNVPMDIFFEKKLNSS